MTYLNWIISYLKSHWGGILALLTAVWAYAAPTIIDYVHNHPKLSFWYGLAVVLVMFYYKRQSTVYYQDKSSTPSR
jgi:hypothetical protein